VAETEGAADTAGVVAPPPLLFAGFLALGLGLDWVLPGRLWPVDPGWPWRWLVAALPIGAAVLLVLAAERSFRAVGTDVRPWRPSTALARSGPYRFTRNPMYLGLVLLLAGVAVGSNGPWLLLQVPLLVLVLQQGVIVREEAYLERKFGEDYRRYRQQVRRWL
jgi:protein-S-isoprenylcysteine O-methyltransferase Ste14